MKKSICIECCTVLCAMLFTLTVFSCATTSTPSKNTSSKEPVKEEAVKEEPAAKPKEEFHETVKSVPTITSKGRGIKIEAEDMFLDGLTMYKDNSASKGYAVKVAQHSVAKCKVVLSAGTWECLVSEQAFHTDKSELFINISGTYYKIYPSNPPLGSWELTTRSPVYLHLEQETTVNVSINADSPYETGSAGMNIDYIQFVRTK